MDFSSVLTCPRVRVLAEAQALTRWRSLPLACPGVVGTAHRLAVDGHHLPRQRLRHPLAPLHEAFLEPPRVQSGEHLAKSVMGRNAVGQVQKGPEPFLLALAEHRHMNPRVGPTDDRANGYGDDVQQRVPLAPLYPRVFQFPKIVHNRPTPPFRHHSSFYPTPLVPSFLTSLTPIMRLPWSGNLSDPNPFV